MLWIPIWSQTQEIHLPLRLLRAGLKGVHDQLPSLGTTYNLDFADLLCTKYPRQANLEGTKFDSFTVIRSGI